MVCGCASSQQNAMWRHISVTASQTNDKSNIFFNNFFGGLTENKIKQQSSALLILCEGMTPTKANYAENVSLFQIRKVSRYGPWYSLAKYVHVKSLHRQVFFYKPSLSLSTEEELHIFYTPTVKQYQRLKNFTFDHLWYMKFQGSVRSFNITKCIILFCEILAPNYRIIFRYITVFEFWAIIRSALI